MAFSPQITSGDEQCLGPHHLSLLIVDDECSIRESCKEVAEALGFDVYLANSAILAERQLREHGIDVALLDLRLPGSNGLDLLSQIKERHPQTEVIIIT